MSSLTTQHTRSGEETSADLSPEHICSACGASPGSALAASGCVHRGRWHSSFTDCNPRCAWKLGRSNLGQCHYSCCFSTDIDSMCQANRTHAFAGVPAPDSVTSSLPLFGVRDCPRYVVDLDAPPEERWNHIVRDYSDELASVVSLTEDILGTGLVANLTTGIFAAAAKLGRVHYGDELKGIAKSCGISLGRVVLLQIAYEAFAACTSIVVNGCDGHPLHIRTMDWDMHELQKLTIEVDFVRGSSNILYRATTWVGYVGILTGLRTDGFSISVNYRRTKSGDQNGVAGVLENLKRGIVGHWPVSFLVREVLETESSFQGAVDALRMSELMAPVYFTIAGTRPGEGLVLSRDREAVPEGTPMRDDLSISETLGVKNSVVQTNMDIPLCDADRESDDWQDICDSRLRRKFAKTALSCGGLNGDINSITMEDLWCLVSFAPCKAHDTVYSTSMVPKTGQLVTRVYATNEQKKAGKKRWKHARQAFNAAENATGGQAHRRSRGGATRQ